MRLSSSQENPQARQEGPPQMERFSSRAEWAIAGIGAAMILAVAGYMGWQALVPDEGPPVVVLEADSVQQHDGSFVVTFIARNQGRSAAEQVKVTGELRRGGRTIDSAEATLQYVPVHSERRGGLFFRHDPAQYELVLQAKGYAKP